MNRTSHLLLDYVEMKTTHRTSPWNPHDAVVSARTMIERERAELFQQQPRLLRLALNEAEALAWQTPYPHLIFPILAEEKVFAIATWHARQSALRRRQPERSFAA